MIIILLVSSANEDTLERKLMPKNAKVFIQYGPYVDCFGQFRHEPCRLEGLKTLLESNEHEIKLYETERLNELAIIVNGQLVFHSEVKRLDFSE